MSELSGIALRRAALEASGWTTEERPHCESCSGHIVLLHPEDKSIEFRRWKTESVDIWRCGPAVESDPAASEPWFLEWCERNGWLWNMTARTFPSRGLSLDLYKPAPAFTNRPTITVFGATPSEARARAVVVASKEGGSES